ncbi:MAG: FHA domain-containing protein [Acidobacteria bacterium]|mgnify:CR=1 FL=1|nr:MAG: FHA domain-containing protein [Acidobacteriota bacterium]REK01372.1 MAG: FHA domain-containing protein [Acidobacteriota bacterium]REK14328.1 MAG: FHA domain-containing protein [Acidobacteriota bacterium]REK45043.1 MAG: FHA domain-containing protein [Acidobacteriota bacterium]
MPLLRIKNADQSTDTQPITRLRTTIGRSARSDICIPDAFASRLHAELRKEGEGYWLQDLGSANGTRYNGTLISNPIPVVPGGEIQIGETTLVFEDEAIEESKNATLIADSTQSLDPSMTISFARKKNPTAEILESQFSSRTDLLGLISKVGVALLSSTGLEETLNQVASLVFEAVPADRVVIMLRDEESAQEDGMKIAVAREREKTDQLTEVRISTTVMEEVMVNGKSVLTSDAQHDPKFASQTMALLGVRSVLAVPLSVSDKDVFGIIYADSPTYENTFTEEHLNILTTLASVASIRVENATLTEERIERERMERELELATEIQQRFQPSAPPQMDSYELQGISFACYEIGGDYYDFIPRHNGNMLIALGDVSGKGTAAALLMSSLHAAIHAQTMARSALPDMVSAVNEYLASNTPSNRFITFFVGELDPESGEMIYINAGHNPPLVGRSDGGVEELASGGFPLGIMPGADFEVGSIKLEEGEAIIVFSDGVSEAENNEGEEFGIDRLSAVVKKHISRSASGLRDKIESSLSAFTGTAPANDDITLVIVKRKHAEAGVSATA